MKALADTWKYVKLLDAITNISNRIVEVAEEDIVNYIRRKGGWRLDKDVTEDYIREDNKEIKFLLDMRTELIKIKEKMEDEYKQDVISQVAQDAQDKYVRSLTDFYDNQ